jgi:flagellar assembly protein FliH
MARIIRSVTLDREPVVISSKVFRTPDTGLAQASSFESLPDIALSTIAHQPIYDAPVGPSLEERQRQAEALHQQAEALHRQAEEFHRQAEQLHREAEEIRAQAQEQGYRAGFEAGRNEAREQWADHLERLAALCGAVDAALEGQILGVEDTMVEIAFAAICKVAGQAAMTQEGLRNIVREAMQVIISREAVVIRISPADYAMLQASPTPERAIVEGIKVEVAADERVTAGGCLIETTGGTLDARLEIQLRELLETLIRAKAAQIQT